ncbi:PREDICTED: transmembrane protein 62-like isoform X2 [Priapulus caudatus]|uniref:Transmembrane protein 62-like isoform X2 n=1 Tax=Priapulus caudatus TaxID=37621 RepID=A0ABM1ELL4_PRICU|nr:PREDICTED: transmembrane protein 62-like isoform X2 [Priapulus caudatus]
MASCATTRLIKMLFVILIGTFAWLAATLANNYVVEFHDTSIPDHSTQQKFNVRVNNPSTYSLGASTKNMMWFIQVSDLHFSIFHDETGDIVDAKGQLNIGSQQYVEEWKMYGNILNSSNVLQKTKVLDIRGNHDSFNVPTHEDQENYFRKYSAQGQQGNLHSYHYIHKDGDAEYSFIAADATLLPGPKRPFNFFGYFQEEEMTLLEKFAEESLSSSGTVWFGHYPTSIMFAPSRFRHVMRSGLAYMCGHLHTLGGIIDRMYAFQKTGNLELELADWKDNRRYRVVAIDHGLLSFVDAQFRKWPIILITNPKDAMFEMPYHEPLESMLNSTHIRILVFSPGAVKAVKVRIDNDQWKDTVHVSGPLYVLAWDPRKFSTGVHTIHATAEDEEGYHGSISQQFSLSGSPVQQLSLLARLLLMTNICTLLQSVFAVLLGLTVIPLTVLKFYRPRPQFNYGCSPISWVKVLLWRLHLLASVNELFYPLVLSAVFLTAGPFFVGEAMDGHIAVFFVWGIYIKGSYLPGDVTFTYGIAHLLTFHLPMILCLAAVIAKRYQAKFLTVGRTLCLVFPVLVVLLYKIWWCFTFYIAYGYLTLLLGPITSWPIVLGMLLFKRATQFDGSKLRNGEYVLNLHPVENCGAENTTL